jgi:hypothetical protein
VTEPNGTGISPDAPVTQVRAGERNPICRTQLPTMVRTAAPAEGAAVKARFCRSAPWARRFVAKETSGRQTNRAQGALLQQKHYPAAESLVPQPKTLVARVWASAAAIHPFISFLE